MTRAIVHGTFERAKLPAARSIPPPNGGFTFAEHPDRDSRSARVIWHAAFDPGTLAVAAAPADPDEPASLRLAAIAPWLTVAEDTAGIQHAVVSNGRQRVRLDVVTGRLTDGEAVRLHVHFEGLDRARAGLLPLQRLLAVARHGRFAVSMEPRDRMVARGITVLRVYDGLSQGASLRELAEILFGADRVAQDVARGSDSLRSRVRRLSREARALAAGGYRFLIRKATG